MRWLVLLWFSVSVAYGQNCRGEERPRDCGVCDKDGKNCTIKAALLLPRNTNYSANLYSVQAVMELAMQDQAIQAALPPDVKFEWLTYDVTDCDAAYAVISAIDAYNDCAHVFFGPSCDFALASVGRFVKFLGISGLPTISTGGFSFDFVNPKQTCDHEFYMMVRSGPIGFKDLAYFLIDVMRHFEWQQVLLITESEGQVHVAGKSTCHLMMKTLVNYLKIENITYIPWDTKSDGGRNNTENLKYYLAYRFDWQRCVLIYDTPSYEDFVGGSGGFLLASTIHNFLIAEGFYVFGKELLEQQSHEEMLLQDVGISYASELVCVWGWLWTLSPFL